MDRSTAGLSILLVISYKKQLLSRSLSNQLAWENCVYTRKCILRLHLEEKDNPSRLWGLASLAYNIQNV
ncbi:hypothetical protein C0J52_15550 [Blattella germanica]|nr:hypothetical protein C0J52_15550 [Blattella germanica]